MSLFVLAAALMAQHTGHHAPAAQPGAQPGAQPATQPPTATAAKSAGLTIDGTPIAELLANPAAKAIVEKHLPGFSSHPSIGMAGRLTLKGVQQYAQGQITDDHLKMIAQELAALPAK